MANLVLFAFAFWAASFSSAMARAAWKGDGYFITKPEIKFCTFRVNKADITSYKEFLVGRGWIVRPCAAGTSYEPKTCTCSNFFSKDKSSESDSSSSSSSSEESLTVAETGARSEDDFETGLSNRTVYGSHIPRYSSESDYRPDSENDSDTSDSSDHNKDTSESSDHSKATLEESNSHDCGKHKRRVGKSKNLMDLLSKLVFQKMKKEEIEEVVALIEEFLWKHQDESHERRQAEQTRKTESNRMFPNAVPSIRNVVPNGQQNAFAFLTHFNPQPEFRY